jgi:hypothetical protein
MGPMFLALALTAGADVQTAPKPGVEGKWLIVYAEEAGRRNNAWEQRVATFKGHKLSYRVDEKDHSLRVAFGHDQTVKATGTEENGDGKEASYTGVYIAGKDYLCLSLRHAKASKDGEGKEEKADAKEEHSSGSFILILRRQTEK